MSNQALLPSSWAPKAAPVSYAVARYSGEAWLETSTMHVMLSWRFDPARPDRKSELLQAYRDSAKKNGATVTEQRWGTGFGITVEDPGTSRNTVVHRSHVVVSGALTWVLAAAGSMRDSEPAALIDRLVQVVTPRVEQLAAEWPGSALKPGLPVLLPDDVRFNPAHIHAYIVDLRWRGDATSRVELLNNNHLADSTHENNIEYARRDGLRTESIQIAPSTEAACGQPLAGPFTQGFTFTKGEPTRPAVIGIVAVGRSWNVRLATTVPAGADRRSAPWRAALAAPADICNSWHWLPPS